MPGTLLNISPHSPPPNVKTVLQENFRSTASGPEGSPKPRSKFSLPGKPQRKVIPPKPGVALSARKINKVLGQRWESHSRISGINLGREELVWGGCNPAPAQTLMEPDQTQLLEEGASDGLDRSAPSRPRLGVSP